MMPPPPQTHPHQSISLVSKHECFNAYIMYIFVNADIQLYDFPKLDETLPPPESESKEKFLFNFLHKFHDARKFMM